MEKKNDTRSLAMLSASMLIFGTIGIFRRYIPLSSALIACFRGFSGALFLLVFLKLTGRKLWYKIGSAKVLGLIITGIMIGFNWILLFEAYNYTTVATATLCYYMQPTIVMLLTPAFFNEKLTKKKCICVVMAIIGMFFVSGMVGSGLPQAAEARGILCGLGAAVLYATVVMINKKMPGIDAYQKTVIQLASAAIVLVPYLAVTEDLTSIHLAPIAIVMLIVVGIVHTGMAYAMYFGSMDGLRMQTVAIASYIDPVSALILSALLLHEPMGISGIIGAILVLASAFIGEM